MQHNNSVVMKRRRFIVNRHEAAAAAVAAISAGPIVPTAEWSPQARNLGACLERQWKSDGYARFPGLKPTGHGYPLDELTSLLSHTATGVYYADYTTFHYDDVVHAHLCISRDIPILDTLGFETCADEETLWATTRSEEVVHSPGHDRYVVSDDELDELVFNDVLAYPGTAAVTMSGIARAFDVTALAGPAFDDPVWFDTPVPGTDIEFDANNPQYHVGVIGRYRLTRRDTAK